MEKPLHPRIPVPLQGRSFLQASHFQIGFDHRPEGSTVASAYRLNYPARWGTFLRKAIMPPKCADVLNQEMGGPWETISEYLQAYPTWSLAARPDACPPSSSIQLHADAQCHAFTSITQENYAYPSEVLPTQPHRVDKWDDSIPEGDKDKVLLPPSLYQQSYPSHHKWSSAVRAPNQHLGSDSIQKGDGRVRCDSIYKSQYTGEWASPPKHCHEVNQGSASLSRSTVENNRDGEAVILNTSGQTTSGSEQKNVYIGSIEDFPREASMASIEAF